MSGTLQNRIRISEFTTQCKLDLKLQAYRTRGAQASDHSFGQLITADSIYYIIVHIPYYFEI